MSWQQYVDTSLVGSGHIDKAAIFSAAGDSVWATSPNFPISPAEMKEIVQGFADPGKDGFRQVQVTGVHVAGDKYVVSQADDTAMYGRKGKDGVVIVKTKQAILVGHHNENAQAGNANNVVMSLGDYLTKAGY